MRDAAALVFVDELDQIALSAPDAHHLVDVLRLDNGALVVASDGNGRYVACDLRIPKGSARRGGRSEQSGVILEPTGPILTVEAPAVPIAVGFALHKGDRPDWAVEKLTELGIDRILVLTTERTVVRPHGGEAERRLARLRRVARQASAQCRRVRLPTVEGPIRYTDALTSAPTPLVVAEPGGPPLGGPVTTILVGPEGGWTDAETTMAPSLVGLSETILRTETAAVAAGVLLDSFRRDRRAH